MTTRTVTGTFQDGAGTPMSGRVVFRVADTTTGSGIIYVGAPVTEVLDVLGAFTVDLVDTDSMTLTGALYEVTEHLNGEPAESYLIDLPAGTSVDLSTLRSYPASRSVVREVSNGQLSIAAETGARIAGDAALAAADAAHTADTTSVHGISDTSALALTANVVARGALTYNVKDYGAVGNGSTDDTAAIQAALTAAGVGGRTFVPPGNYVVASTLTIPALGVLYGSSFEQGSGSPSVTQLSFAGLSGATTAVVMGSGASLRDITIRGPGATVGTVKGITGGTVFLDRVCVLAFASGTVLTGGYYIRMKDVEWSRNATALTLSGCFNVSLFAPRIMAGYGASDATYGTAIVTDSRGLSVYGGSIETFTTGVTVQTGGHLGLFGVYVETPSDATAGVVWADGRDKVSVVAVGCFVYLNGCTRFITTAGSTNASIVSHGNHFVSVSGSSTTPTAYIWTAGHDVELWGDNWTEMAKVGAAYTSVSGGLPALNAVVTIPTNAGTNAGMTYDGRRRVVPTALQTLAVNGAVTIDASAGDARITLNANATSSSITNPMTNQELSITWVQDGTGGRTYSWPADCRFAGNSAPSDTTLNTRTQVRFRYDGGTGRWYEIRRAVAVPNS